MSIYFTLILFYMNSLKYALLCLLSTLLVSTKIYALIEVGGKDVDAFLVDDVETSLIDFSSKSSECSNISPFKYAKLHTDGSLKCELCGREAFLESYNADTRDSTIAGTKHGPCCQNSHHRVCRKMLEEYKLRCEYEDLVATKAANFGGSWYGKGVDANHQKCGEFTAV